MGRGTKKVSVARCDLECPAPPSPLPHVNGAPAPPCSTSAADVIVRFTQRLLACEWEPGLAHVASAFVFTCRQMYNTCEGLHALRNYGLHDCIARAWRKVGTFASAWGVMWSREVHPT